MATLEQIPHPGDRMVAKQRLVYFEPTEGRADGRGSPVIDVGGEKPERIWTLTGHRQADGPPALPYYPEHGRNAFLEDVGHDWTWLRGGRIRYSGTAADRGGCWLLLEDVE